MHASTNLQICKAGHSSPLLSPSCNLSVLVFVFFILSNSVTECNTSLQENKIKMNLSQPLWLCQNVLSIISWPLDWSISTAGTALNLWPIVLDFFWSRYENHPPASLICSPYFCSDTRAPKGPCLVQPPPSTAGGQPHRVLPPDGQCQPAKPLWWPADAERCSGGRSSCCSCSSSTRLHQPCGWWAWDIFICCHLSQWFPKWGWDSVRGPNTFLSSFKLHI